MEKGPVTSDEIFFSALSDELGGMKELAEKGEYKEARKRFASYIRKNLRRDEFLTIPYEAPENLFKLPGESDEEAVRRIEEYKVVSVGILGDFSKERRVGWFSNPTYNGYKEWTWQLSRHNGIKMMAHEYNRTGDERIAASALDIMGSWLEDATVPPPGTDGHDTLCWRTIECGIRMGGNWPYILFSFIKSPSFTDDLIVDWFKSVYEHAMRLTAARTGANWLIMEMNGLAHIGMLFPFFRDAGKWLDDAVSTLEKEIGRQFYADGFQYELSTNYHDVAINNYQRLFETARAFGVALPESMREKLRKACDTDVSLMMPDGCLPDLNDGNRSIVRKVLTRKSRIFLDDDIKFALEGGKEPEYRSLILPYSGFAIWRTGWGEDDVWALFDSAPFGRGHQHEDKLNLIIYACRKYLVPEGGNYAYDDSEMRRYILSTRSHNTVRVDGRDQDRRSRYEWHEEDIRKHSGIRSSIPDDEEEWAEGTYDEGYEGISDKVVHTRKVIFLRKERLFAVIDSLHGGEEHEYEVIWHIDDEIISGTDFRDIRVTVPSEDISISVVRGQTEPEVQGYISYGQAQGSYREVNTILIRGRGTDRTIVTILQPKDSKGNPLEKASISGSTLHLDFPGYTKKIPLG